MSKKRAGDVESGDYVVDNLGYIRAVWYVVTYPIRLVGIVSRMFVFRDGEAEFHDPDYEIDVLDDERGY